MTPEAFEDLLDRHGGDLARWPDAARDGAMALLPNSARAREALALMREAERLLSLSRAMPQGGVDVIAARAMRRHQLRPARRAVYRAGWAATAAAALAMGILVGSAERPPNGDDTGFAMAAGSAETSYVE